MSGEDVTKLFQRHVPLAYRVALAATGSTEDAEDAVQEAFLHVLRSAERIDPAGNVRAYVARAVANAARGIVCARTRRARHEAAAPPKEDAMPPDPATAIRIFSMDGFLL